MRNSIIHTINILLLSSFFIKCDNRNIDQQKPNFVFILADNLGYGDIGCFGSEVHITPNIDKMAEEGVRLTSLYSSSGVCTPSRASLMTGCYAQRIDMHLSDKNGWVLRPVAAKGLNPEEITIAEILKEQDYATGCIGKWHLGDQPEFLPLNQGFDYFYGIPYSEDMVPSVDPDWPDLPLMQNNKVIEAPADLTTTTQRYVNKAIEFIIKNRNKPFFLYFPHNLPGSRAIPVVSDHFRNRSANGAWGDSVEEIDWSVGEIIKALNELELEDNTMIVFTSDNGAPRGGRAKRSGMGSNEPFAGAGYSTMEGGMRVPCILKWPGKIPAGISNDHLCTMMDWLPTFAFLANAKVAGDRIIDGKNIWPLISGDENAKSPHGIFCYYLMDQLQAVRKDNWKLHLPLENKYNGGNRDKYYGSSKLKLIDLSKDLKEEKDLSSQFPGIVKELLEYSDSIKEELGNTSQKGKDVRPAGYVNDPKPLIVKN